MTEITYRPADLGRMVRPPDPEYWEPPRCLDPHKDPYLLHKVLAALRRL